MISDYDPRMTSASPTIEGALTPQAERYYAAEMPFQAALNWGREGTSSADLFASGAPVPGSPFTPANPLAMLGQFQAAQQEAQGQQVPAFSKITMKADGSVSLDTDQNALAEVFAQLTDLKQMKTAAMARVAQLKQQESSGSPILDALSQFAGNMAQNDPTMPGWVRAIGATNLQMGPQGIKRERMAEEAKAFAYGREIADTALQAARMQDEKYKMTLSFIEDQRKAAEAADKGISDALIKWRKEGRAQITTTGGEYDAEGMRAELETLGLPQEQIEAQLSSLAQYADDRKQHLAAVEGAKDEKERRKRQQELADWEASQNRIDARAAQRREDTFGWNVMKNSIPTKPDVDVVKNTSEMLRLLDKAESYLGQVPAKYRGGPVEGWFRGKNPWRGGKDQAAFQTSYQLTLKALEASGLKPISEIEFENQAKQMFNPKLTWRQNMAIVGALREQVMKGTADYLQMQPHRNWTAVSGILPPALQQMIPDLERRRMELYSAGAPGQQRPATGLPAGWKIEEVK